MSNHFRKTDLVSDPLLLFEREMRRWRGTGLVVSLMLEPVSESIWPDHVPPAFTQTILPQGGRSLSEWANQTKGLEEMREELLLTLADMWSYKHWLDNLEGRSEDAFQAGQEAWRLNPFRFGHMVRERLRDSAFLSPITGVERPEGEERGQQCFALRLI
jgi:hypothetical protein